MGKILIVDDSRTSRKMLREILEDMKLPGRPRTVRKAMSCIRNSIRIL